MRGPTAVALLVVTAARVGAEPLPYCPAGEVVEVSGVIEEITTTDPDVPEIVLERALGKCEVDAIQVQGAVPANCAEGRRATAEGMVAQSRDGTWTWVEADEVRCE